MNLITKYYNTEKANLEHWISERVPAKTYNKSRETKKRVWNYHNLDPKTKALKIGEQTFYKEVLPGDWWYSCGLRKVLWIWDSFKLLKVDCCGRFVFVLIPPMKHSEIYSEIVEKWWILELLLKANVISRLKSNCWSDTNMSRKQKEKPNSLALLPNLKFSSCIPSWRHLL